MKKTFALLFCMALAACSKNSVYSGTDSSFAALSISSLSLGSLHSCAVTNHGTFCWGSNAYNELGDRSFTAQSHPVPMTEVDGFSQLSSGYSYNCALVSGQIRCWGFNYQAMLGNTSVNSQVTATCSISSPCDSPVPVAVEQIGGGGALSGALAVAAGTHHACAITSSGGVACWGTNYSGELGNGTITSSEVPVQATGLLSGTTAVAVASGGTTCAITTGGAVMCWGYNLYGQIGDNTTVDKTIPVAANVLTSGVTAISASANHFCAIQAGAVYCWGQNNIGQLGDGTFTNRHVPTAVSGLTTGATALASGGDFTCALVSGAIYCWGYNLYGNLGNGASSTFTNTPALVIGMGSGVTAIGAGLSHTCAIMGAHVYCWGDNTYGQLGTGTNISKAVPMQVVDPINK